VLDPEENCFLAPYLMNKERGDANDPRYHVLALSQTCRQIYHEAYHMIFELNAFSIENERALGNWDGMFGARMQNIHTVRIHTTNAKCDYRFENKMLNRLNKFPGLQTVEVVVAPTGRYRVFNGRIEMVESTGDDVAEVERNEVALAEKIEWWTGKEISVKFLQKRCRQERLER
jgi:hypothetical protein